MQLLQHKLFNVKIQVNQKILSMVEKWDPCTSGSHGPPGPPGPLDPRTPWDLTTLGKLPLPFEIQTFLNYIIGQSQTKAENCV